MIPARGLLLVRPVETDDTLPGGRIMLVADTRERMTTYQCEVVAVGEPVVCEDEDCERGHLGPDVIVANGARTEFPRVHPCFAALGAWLLVRPRSYIEGPVPERKEWFVHQDNVLAILREDA